MYSSGIPLVYLVLLASLVVTYFTDKWLILNYNKRAKSLTSKSLLMFVNMLKFGIVLHLIVGGLMFMNDNMFDESESGDIVFS